MSAPHILAAGKTPAEWVELFSERGIEVSERKLRETARRIGACHLLGNAMMILPEHIDRIWQECTPCPSNSTNADQPGGLKGGSTPSPEVGTTGEARRHLMKQQRVGKPRRSKPASSKVIMLEKPRH